MATFSTSPHPSFVAGIDGGGTSTRALVASVDGLVCGLGRAGPSNPNQVGADGCRTAVAEALNAAWADAGIAPAAQHLSALFLGIAGAGAFGAERLKELLQSALPGAAGARMEVDHDLRIALAAGLEAEPGIVLIAGTGSSCYGRNAEGKSTRSGGWGPWLDDVGGGFWFGREAMIAATREADGRGAMTALRGEVLRGLQVEEIARLPARLHAPGLSRDTIAHLAPRVLAAAEAGDSVAQAIAIRGATELADMARAVAERLFPEREVPVVLMGGLSLNSYYKALVENALLTLSPKLSLKRVTHAPVTGALLLALELAGHLDTAAALQAADAKAQV